MSGRLDGLVAVVTGGGGGLGRAISLGLAAEGARVLVNDLGATAVGNGHDAGRAQEVSEAIAAADGEAIADGGDVTDRADASAMIAKVIERWGRLDILVNVAGIIRLGTAVDTPPEDFEDILRVNLHGAFNTTQFAARHWVERGEYGRLINFASGASLVSQPSLLAYSTSKTGIMGFTRSCANALVSYGVTANCIRPSASTAMMDMASPDAWELERRTGRRQSDSAAGTSLDPAHVVPLVVFLASPAAAHVSGRLLEGRGGKYVLWTEPQEEQVVERDFLAEPEAVYAGLEEQLCAGLSLRDLPMPMAPLADMGDWKSTYGTRTPLWDFR